MRYIPTHLLWGVFPLIYHEVYPHSPIMRYIPIHLSWGISPLTYYEVFSHSSIMRYIPTHLLWGIFPLTYHEVYSHSPIMKYIPTHLSWGIFPLTYHEVYSNSPIMRYIPTHLSWGIFPTHLYSPIMRYIPTHLSWGISPLTYHEVYSYSPIMRYIPTHLSWGIFPLTYHEVYSHLQGARQRHRALRGVERSLKLAQEETERVGESIYDQGDHESAHDDHPAPSVENVGCRSRLTYKYGDWSLESISLILALSRMYCYIYSHFIRLITLHLFVVYQPSILWETLAPDQKYSVSTCSAYLS